MAGRIRKAGPDLDRGDVRDLSRAEIEMILRAADPLIMSGGRNMLVKILKGSKDKKLLEHGLEDNPAYGFYRELTLEQIGHRVDWMILSDYLEIQYDYRLPLLVFTKKGWEIEKYTYAREMYEIYKKDRSKNRSRSTGRLNSINPQVSVEVLRWIADEGTGADLPALEAWKEKAQGQVRKKIAFAVSKIRTREEKAGGGALRLFIGVPVEGKMKEQLTEALERMKEAGIGGRYQPAENLHMTLVFLGETPAGRAGEVLDLLQSVPVPDTRIRIEGSGYFGNILYARIGIGEEETFHKYVMSLRRALGRRGLSFDSKPFKAHVTLIRRCSVTRSFAFDPAPQKLGRICLYKSEEKGGRMVYTELGSVLCGRED